LQLSKTEARFAPHLDDSNKIYAILIEISFYFRTTFGVAHATSTLITLPPLRRSLICMVNSATLKL
jgi:hypothetical protein